jgi:hypothetical protein
MNALRPELPIPLPSHYADQRTSIPHRNHVHESVIERTVNEPVRGAGLVKPAKCQNSLTRSKEDQYAAVPEAAFT